MAQDARTAGCVLPRFPVHALDVFGGHSQAVTATQTAALQHGAAIFGCHALAEAMHTLAAANFRLPSTLG